MDQVIATLLPLAASKHVSRELIHVGEQLLLADGAGRSGRHVDDPHSLHPVSNLRKQRIIATGEYVHLVTQRCQVTGELTDIHVLAAAIDPAQQGQRRRVLADDRDALCHADFLSSVPSVAAAAESPMEWAAPKYDGREPVTSWKAAFQFAMNRLMLNRRSARSRAPFPSRRASAGSRSRWRIATTSASTFVET